MTSDEHCLVHPDRYEVRTTKYEVPLNGIEIRSGDGTGDTETRRGRGEERYEASMGGCAGGMAGGKAVVAGG